MTNETADLIAWGEKHSKPSRELAGVLDWVGSAVDVLIPGGGLITAAADLAAPAVLAPNAAAGAAYEKVKAKWHGLEHWWSEKATGVPASSFGDSLTPWFVAVSPGFQAGYDHWKTFRASWEAGAPDLTDLQAVTHDVEEAENVASGYGYPGAYHPNTNTGTYGSDNVVHAPGVGDQSIAQEGAAATKKAVDTAEKVATETLKSGATALVPGWSLLDLPWYVKVIGGVVLVGAAVVGIKAATAPARPFMLARGSL